VYQLEARLPFHTLDFLSIEDGVVVSFKPVSSFAVSKSSTQLFKVIDVVDKSKLASIKSGTTFIIEVASEVFDIR